MDLMAHDGLMDSSTAGTGTGARVKGIMYDLGLVSWNWGLRS